MLERRVENVNILSMEAVPVHEALMLWVFYVPFSPDGDGRNTILPPFPHKKDKQSRDGEVYIYMKGLTNSLKHRRYQDTNGHQ